MPEIITRGGILDEVIEDTQHSQFTTREQSEMNWLTGAHRAYNQVIHMGTASVVERNVLKLPEATQDLQLGSQ